jgi:hypothetical protein
MNKGDYLQGTEVHKFNSMVTQKMYTWSFPKQDAGEATVSLTILVQIGKRRPSQAKPTDPHLEVSPQASPTQLSLYRE